MDRYTQKHKYTHTHTHTHDLEFERDTCIFAHTHTHTHTHTRISQTSHESFGMFGECCAGHDAPGADPEAAGSEPAPLSFHAGAICLIASMHPSNTLFLLFFSCAMSSSRCPPPGWPPEPPGSIVSRICVPEAASVVALAAARRSGPAREVRRRKDCSCQGAR